jgi:hypothetical protein
MHYKYAYITGCLILFFFWILIFLKRKDLRKEMIWASLLGMPFGFIDFFLVPKYWNPDSLFGLIKKYGAGIESFFFFFAMSGIAAVIYEFLERKKIKKIKGDKKLHLAPLVLTLASFLILTKIFPLKAVYNGMIATAAGALTTICLRKDLWKQIVISGFIFSLFYSLVFFFVGQIFTGFVYDFYNFDNIWGIIIFGIPLEEIVIAFFAGAFWSTIYEYAKAYREN